MGYDRVFKRKIKCYDDFQVYIKLILAMHMNVHSDHLLINKKKKQAKLINGYKTLEKISKKDFLCYINTEYLEEHIITLFKNNIIKHIKDYQKILT